LIDEVPWVEFAILGVVVVHDSLLRWVHLHSKVPHLCNSRTLLLDLSVRPAEQLNDSSLLTAIVL
jgi:hypothetical protein